MSRRTIVQKGRTGSDLFIYCHLDPSILAARAKSIVPNDAVVSELWGNGTAAYAGAVQHYGGWLPWIHQIQKECGVDEFRRVYLTTWSAGSAVALSVCQQQPENARPDAIVMLDGFYGSKPAGSKQGDGRVLVTEQMGCLADYAIKAAYGDGYRFISTYSHIQTPYASSRECNEWLRAQVEAELATCLAPDLLAEEVNGHKFLQSWRHKQFFMYAFAGQDAKEHIRHAHMFNEIWHWLKTG